jgi:hypothetical protein
MSAVVSSRPHSRSTYRDETPRTATAAATTVTANGNSPSATTTTPAFAIITDTVPSNHGDGDIGEVSGSTWDTTVGEESVGNIVGLSAVGVDTTTDDTTSNQHHNNGTRSDSQASISIAPSMVAAASTPLLTTADDHDAMPSYPHHQYEGDYEAERTDSSLAAEGHMMMMDDTERSVSVSAGGDGGSGDTSELPSGVNSMRDGHYIPDGHGNLVYADGTYASRSLQIRLMGNGVHPHHQMDPDSAAYYFTHQAAGAGVEDGYYDEDGSVTQAMLDAGYLVDGGSGNGSGEYEFSHAQHAHLYHLHQRLLASAAAGHLTVANAHSVGEEEPEEDEDDGDDDDDPTKHGANDDDDIDDDEDDDENSDDEPSDDDHTGGGSGDSSEEETEKEEWKKPREQPTVAPAGTTIVASSTTTTSNNNNGSAPTAANGERVIARKLTGVTDLKTATPPVQKGTFSHFCCLYYHCIRLCC